MSLDYITTKVSLSPVDFLDEIAQNGGMSSIIDLSKCQTEIKEYIKWEKK